MDKQYNQLVASTAALQDQSGGRRILIALAGPPGSGKTTSAHAIAARLNALHPARAGHAVVASMDGFHYPRSYLDTLPNREEAYIRRGAPWTFDAEKIVKFIASCRHDEAVITAPTFDHALKDPVDGGLAIPPETRVVIFEGNYLLVNEEPWGKVKGLVDQTWLVTVDAEEARQRVARRHVDAGIEPDLVAALRRVDANDALNGVYIMQHSLGRANVVIESIDEKGV